MQYQIKKTADGSSTIYLPGMDEQYHSLNGAFTESEHVFIKMGYLHQSASEPVVFEVGFGTGLNCLLTAVWAQKLKRCTLYYTVEKYPVEKEWIEKLGYGALISEEADELYRKIHACKWDEKVQISEYFHLVKMQKDITKDKPEIEQPANVVFFDAFGPDKQPEMWTPRIFERLNKIMAPQGVFVTYSAKGQVRRDLSAAGFSMERLPGPPGKKEMLRGIKVDSGL
jgi:tRNA U34 5-methylaminomethyl-2-thiouridine-forming methyltransferase MnmC